METAVHIENLHKSFKLGFIPKTKKILKGISLTVNQGEIFGYLGPNGAGKTTTIKCILGLIYPDQGKIELFGHHHLSLKAKTQIGFLPENPYFYDHLTALEFLYFYSQLFLIKKNEREKKIKNLIQVVGLEKWADLQLRKFSRGMLQRIGLAQALLNEPSLVLLDEPLGGLDPIGRKEIRDIIVLSYPAGYRDDLRPGGHHRQRRDHQPGNPPGSDLGENPVHGDRDFGCGYKRAGKYGRAFQRARRKNSPQSKEGRRRGESP
jgi:ABC-2 type transport system ATP-binding protein